MAPCRPAFLEQLMAGGFQPDDRLIAEGPGRGEHSTVSASWTALRAAPEEESGFETQLLYGETVSVFDEKDGWARIQSQRDGYVGYVKKTDLVPPQHAATHQVAVPMTHLYPKADLKTAPIMALPATAWLALTDDEAVKGFRAMRSGGWVYAKHVRPLTWRAPDFLGAARTFLHAPYLWGGRTAAGLDCSALLQISLALAGIPALRDTDQQAQTVGQEVPDWRIDSLEKGDIVFFPGHVGIMADKENLLHANATAMQVTIDPLSSVMDIVRKDHREPVTAIRRID